ncbi:MAG: (2Fe-2S)-binding protein [Thermodesulfobacteriota bacterium]
MKEDEKKNCQCRDRECKEEEGVTRRGFLTSVGFGAMAFAAGGKITTPAPVAAATAGEAAADTVSVVLKINNRSHRLLVEPRWSLLYVLREILGFTGTKVGCERGECGACTVLIDDVTRYACLTLAVEAEGRRITTVEGLMRGEKLGPVQQAFVEKDAMQCGYCTPGQIMSVEGLLRRNSDPTREQIRLGVSGNLCRCGSYEHIFEAAARASELKRD